jgi:hypothetical protein
MRNEFDPRQAAWTLVAGVFAVIAAAMIISLIGAVFSA